MGFAVVDVDVRHHGRVAGLRAQGEVGDVADVLVFAVAGELPYAVHEQLHAWSGVVGEAPSLWRVVHFGDEVPVGGGGVQSFQPERAARRIARQGVGAVPRQVDFAVNVPFGNGDVDAAEVGRGVGHALDASVGGHLDAGEAMGQVVRVVQEGGHDPSGGQLA